MTHLTRNDCASALRLLEQLESAGAPARHHGDDGLRAKHSVAQAPGRHGLRHVAPQADYCQRAPQADYHRRAGLADYYRRAGLEHAVAVAFLYRLLTCRAELPLSAAPDATVQAAGTVGPAPVLTPREGDVMHWLSRGKTDAEIAALLEISPRTVHKHLEHVYVKLGVETRTAAVMRALERHALASPVNAVGVV
jgi:DNA-binding CsgD family transcriptional regulator